MEDDQPLGLWLRMSGCCNDVVWVDVQFLAPHAMLLRHGWRTFAGTHYLADGHVLRFKLVEQDMLPVKVFGHVGAHLGCCKESSSDDKSSSSSDSDEEDTGGEHIDEEPQSSSKNMTT